MQKCLKRPLSFLSARRSPFFVNNITRWYSSEERGIFVPPLKVCIVGSGPAGFYATKYLLQNMAKMGRKLHVSMLEKFPTPYGLVRYGVAPDHPEVKSVINDFDKVASQSENYRFYGNVNVGTDVTMDELRHLYDAIILSYGAEGEKKLGAQGEDSLRGVESARQFVNWYNGLPDFKKHQDSGNGNSWFQTATRTYTELLSTAKRVVIIGQGNVAVDVARLLAKPATELGKYDTTDYALDVLRSQNVNRVQLVGRRGPVQAACTTNELRELTKIEGTSLYFHSRELELDDLSKQELEKIGRAKKRMLDVMLANTSSPKSDSRCVIEFDFLRNPVEFLGDSKNNLRAVRFERTVLTGTPGDLKSIPTGQFEEIECDVCFRSIGYKSSALPGIPFDHSKGIVPNQAGKVIEPTTGSTLDGLYVCGWLKRGPTGVILSNIVDAQETVQSVIHDLVAGKLEKEQLLHEGHTGLETLLHKKHVQFITFEEYKKIEQHEYALGKGKGKIREKLTSVDEMLRIAKE